MSDGVRRLRFGDKRTLRVTLGLFLLALLVPTALLLQQAYRQLQSEAFYQQRVQAEEFAQRIDARIGEMIGIEERRPLADYGFVVAQDPTAQIVQRSPLASFPPPANLPGLLAYFQIDSSGAFSTPLLPATGNASTFGIGTAELTQRRALQERVRQLLVTAGPAGEPTGKPATAALAKQSVDTESQRNQAAFERLADAPAAAPTQQNGGIQYRRIDELKLDAGYAARDDAADARERQIAPAREAVAAAPAPALDSIAQPAPDRMRMFDLAPDAFALRPLDAAHLVLFRKASSDGERVVQGAVLARDAFIEGLVTAPFRSSALARTSGLIVGYQDAIAAAVDVHAGAAQTDAATRDGELLYRTALAAPLHDFQLIFTAAQLPVGPGGRLLGWLTLVLAIVLCGGFWVVYRFGVRQIELAAQQQDFVAAVSHELKTPLTSIRMYGEMLRAGWADDAKKQSYYDFIFQESERLSRLISNVLRLARLTRNGDELDRKPVRAGALLDLAKSRIAMQIDQAGFELRIDAAQLDERTVVRVDADSFVQILINLVDNALKFAAHAERKVVELGVRQQHDGSVQFWVRDYGPGVPKAQMKKIFELFYRGRGELTRETVGTGIGLALVQELTSAMGGKVQVRNCEPGAEFSVTLPSVAAS